MGEIYDTFVDGVQTSDFAITNDYANLPSALGVPGIMVGGSDSAINAIKDYLSAQDNPDDEEKVKQIKEKIDPDNKLNADEIVDVLDKLLNKAGKSWNNSRINQALSLVLIMNSIKSFTNLISDGKNNKPTKKGK